MDKMKTTCRMNKRLLYTTIIILLLWGGLSAQSDTLLLKPKELGAENIITPVFANDKVKIISGSRFPTEAGELPFSSYVITREEIRLNGYETLVDALKMAPGIFSSQPGSGMEGETFLMRGLLGNTYTKILVNDIPVKPSFIASMPIGAQLPIREAERIEIIYGAGLGCFCRHHQYHYPAIRQACVHASRPGNWWRGIQQCQCDVWRAAWTG